MPDKNGNDLSKNDLSLSKFVQSVYISQLIH